MIFSKTGILFGSFALIGLIVLVSIYCIYRIFKWIQSKRIEEPTKLPFEKVTEVVVQKRVKICKLPPHFGPDAFVSFFVFITYICTMVIRDLGLKLFTITENLDRGIKHVFVRHPGDFATSKMSNEYAVIKHLRKHLTAENFIGAEDDPRGNRYIWKSRVGQNGPRKQLVTILSPRGKGYELITAYKR